MPFSEKTIKFLVTNKENNSKEWYHAHKDDLEKYVRQPFEELINEVLPVIQECDPYADCNPRIGRGISRIYRDTRFSYDKTLFRSSCWCTFMRPKKLYPDTPAFYFEITPFGVAYGCGYYWMDKEHIARVRDMVEQKDDFWIAANDAYMSQNVFVLEGEKYKRTKFPHLSDEARNWADRKSIAVSTFSPNRELMFSPDLPKVVAEDMRKIFPVYTFLFEAAQSKEVAKITKDTYWR